MRHHYLSSFRGCFCRGTAAPLVDSFDGGAFVAVSVGLGAEFFLVGLVGAVVFLPGPDVLSLLVFVPMAGFRDVSFADAAAWGALFGLGF